MIFEFLLVANECALFVELESVAAFDSLDALDVVVVVAERENHAFVAVEVQSSEAFVVAKEGNLEACVVVVVEDQNLMAFVVEEQRNLDMDFAHLMFRKDASFHRILCNMSCAHLEAALPKKDVIFAAVRMLVASAFLPER